MNSPERITIDADIQTSGTDRLGVHTDATHLMLSTAVGDIPGIHQRLSSDYYALDSRGWHALSYGSACNQLEGIKILVSHDHTYIDRCTYEGYTPMMFAAHNGHIHIVDFLIRAGGSIYCQDMKGYTALHFAVLRGHLEIVKLLIALAHTKEFTHGWDALTMAVRQDKEEIVLAILRSPDISVDPIDHNGQTPLEVILKEFVVNPRICIALVVHGASLTNITNKSHRHVIQEALLQRDLVPIRQVLLASTSIPVVLLDLIAAYSCPCPEDECKRRRSTRNKACIVRLFFKCFR